MKLRLVSYNVHGFVGTDGQLDVERVAQGIRELDAHVVGLQEVPFERQGSSFRPCKLLELLPEFRAAFAPIVRGDGYVHGNALLARGEITRSEALCISYHHREPRTALEVELSVETLPLRIITTHLGLKPGERRFQVRTLLRHLATQPDRLTVLLGDFNEWFLMGRPLRWLESYFGRSPMLSTFPSRFPLFALDRIWVHPREHRVRYEVARGALFKCASDHLPLIAEVNLPDPS